MAVLFYIVELLLICHTRNFITRPVFIQHRKQDENLVIFDLVFYAMFCFVLSFHPIDRTSDLFPMFLMYLKMGIDIVLHKRCT